MSDRLVTDTVLTLDAAWTPPAPATCGCSAAGRPLTRLSGR